MIEGKIVFEGNLKGLDIVVRHVKKSDTEQLRTFINTLSKEQTYIMYQGRQLTSEEEEKYVTDFIEKAEMGYGAKLVALHENTIIGVADVTRSVFESELHIGAFGLTVAKEWRGKGVGSFLMDTMLQEVPKTMPRVNIIRLGVFSNNPIAENIYKKRGFIRYGVLPKGLLHRGAYVDHILMYKII